MIAAIADKHTSKPSRSEEDNNLEVGDTHLPLQDCGHRCDLVVQGGDDDLLLHMQVRLLRVFADSVDEGVPGTKGVFRDLLNCERNCG